MNEEDLWDDERYWKSISRAEEPPVQDDEEEGEE
jgi:hypothetical protein